MNIFYTIHSLSNSGGMERVIILKANYLADKFGYNVSIILYDQNDLNTYYEISEKVKVIPISDIIIKELGVFKSIASYIDKKKPDVYISTGGKDILVAKMLSTNVLKLLEMHFCFKFPYLRELSRNSSVFFRALSIIKIVRNIYYARFFNYILALTEKDRQLWEQYSNVKSVTIFNPADFAPVTRHKSLSDVVNFISVGRLDSQKGFADLIHIFSLVKMKNWTLNIYGSGMLKEYLTELILSYKLQDKVFINNAVKNIKEKYLDSDCFLLSSYYEGMPMVLLEAMSSGLPCISFDCDSGPSQLIKNDINGYLIPNRDVKAFASKLDSFILFDKCKYLSMSNNASMTMDEYAIDKVLGQLKLFLESNI
jgi:glycosyltransferase involved in cell wall biosynthesis